MPKGHYERKPRSEGFVSMTDPIVVIGADSAPVITEAVIPLAEDMPQRMRLTAAHGYIEDRFNRGVFHWPAGTVLISQDEIDHLRERGAMMEPDA